MYERITIKNENHFSLDSFSIYLPHIPWPCRDGAGFQMSKTWRQQMGFPQRWGCPVLQRPAGSGSSAPGSGGLSFSWRIVGVSPYGGPDTQPCKHPHRLWWGLLCSHQTARRFQQNNESFWHGLSLVDHVCFMNSRYSGHFRKTLEKNYLTHKLHYWWVWLFQSHFQEVSSELVSASVGIYSMEKNKKALICTEVYTKVYEIKKQIKYSFFLQNLDTFLELLFLLLL